VSASRCHHVISASSLSCKAAEEASNDAAKKLVLRHEAGNRVKRADVALAASPQHVMYEYRMTLNKFQIIPSCLTVSHMCGMAQDSLHEEGIE